MRKTMLVSDLQTFLSNAKVSGQMEVCITTQMTTESANTCKLVFCTDSTKIANVAMVMDADILVINSVT